MSEPAPGWAAIVGRASSAFANTAKALGWPAAVTWDSVSDDVRQRFIRAAEDALREEAGRARRAEQDAALDEHVRRFTRESEAAPEATPMDALERIACALERIAHLLQQR